MINKYFPKRLSGQHLREWLHPLGNRKRQLHQILKGGVSPQLVSFCVSSGKGTPSGSQGLLGAVQRGQTAYPTIPFCLQRVRPSHAKGSGII